MFIKRWIKLAFKFFYSPFWSNAFLLIKNAFVIIRDSEKLTVMWPARFFRHRLKFWICKVEPSHERKIRHWELIANLCCKPFREGFQRPWIKKEWLLKSLPACFFLNLTDPEQIWTADLPLRRRTLYPAELQDHCRYRRVKNTLFVRLWQDAIHFGA